MMGVTTLLLNDGWSIALDEDDKPSSVMWRGEIHSRCEGWGDEHFAILKALLAHVDQKAPFARRDGKPRLRDEFAMEAMGAIIAKRYLLDARNSDAADDFARRVAKGAYRYADAMLKAREVL